MFWRNRIKGKYEIWWNVVRSIDHVLKSHLLVKKNFSLIVLVHFSGLLLDTRKYHNYCLIISLHAFSYTFFNLNLTPLPSLFNYISKSSERSLFQRVLFSVWLLKNEPSYLDKRFKAAEESTLSQFPNLSSHFELNSRHLWLYLTLTGS